MAGFNFGFFGNQEHRVFNYKPRYYDVEAEERRKMLVGGMGGRGSAVDHAIERAFAAGRVEAPDGA